MSDKQHAHELLDRLEPSQMAAVIHLMEVMIEDDDDDEPTEEERRAVAASREYFRQGGEGVHFEQVVAECGFTMEQIRTGADLVAAMQAFALSRESPSIPVECSLPHYEGQSEADAVAEDEAGVRPSETVMNVPHELVSKVRELIGKRRG